MERKITLVVHKPFVTFHWGKAVFARFQKVKSKYGISIKIIERSEDISKNEYKGFVFLMGVNSKWIDDVIERISNPDLQIVLLFGRSSKYALEISSINFDERDIVKKAIEMLHKKHRYKIALFGIQENDTSDAEKAKLFAENGSYENIYRTKDDIEECFMRFYQRISEYDSVICANDIIAVYLCKRCRECGIDIPGQLYVVGNGGIWLADNVFPRLSTVVYNLESMADIAIRSISSIVMADNLSSFAIKIKMQIVDRESTEGEDREENSDITYYPQSKILYSDSFEIVDENMNRIKNIDDAFSSLSLTDRKIIRELITDNKYDEVSKRLFMTIDATRYHIKKIYKALEIHTAQELRDIIEEYQIKI